MFDRLYIELENDAMRYIYGSMSRKKVNIRKWGIKNLTEGCFANGRVMDEVEFIKSLSALRKDLKIFRCTVHLTVNDGSFITRPIELPILKEKDIEKHLSLEAEQYLPINKKNFQVDFRVIERRKESDEAGSSVMVSAGPKENIENILKCFDRCRLDAKVIDVYPNNICRLLKNLDEEDFAVIDMGRRSINITIIESKKFYMHTNIPVNMESLFEDYIKDNSIEMNDFRREYFYAGFDALQINKDDILINDSMRDTLSGVVGQVSRYLDYFNSRHFGKTVDNVYVIGENGMLKGLRKSMSDSFNTNVTIGMKPFPLLDSIRGNSFLEAQMGYHSLLGMILRGNSI
ncbi:MAG TPA: pilus assembly protein PilM [Clostridia bacterium]|nr:pilus assembly protein PilM [Clostridia bacterium]